MTYKDYILNYYFNDELIFKMSVEDFINKIEPKLWTDEQIDEFCGFKTVKNEINSLYLMIGIILLSLVIIFLTTTIILSVKLCKQNKKNKEMVSQISMVEKDTIFD